MIIGKNWNKQNIDFSKSKHAENYFKQAKQLVNNFAPVTDDEEFKRGFTKHVNDYISNHPVLKYQPHPFDDYNKLVLLEQRFKQFYVGTFDENNPDYNYVLTSDTQKEQYKVAKDLCKALNSLNLTSREKFNIHVPLVSFDGMKFIVDCEAIIVLK